MIPVIGLTRTFSRPASARPILGLALCILASGMMVTKAAANTPEVEAQALNRAYETGASFERSPVEMFTMLLCSALWNHWDTIVSRSTDSKFTGSLRPELSSSHAKKRKIYLERMARREMDEEDDAGEFTDTQVSAQSMADEVYEAYSSGRKSGKEDLAGWLGEC